MKIPIIHPITRMIVGGAQLTVLQTCQLLDPNRFESTLLSGPQLGPEGDLLTTARRQVPTVVVPTLVREINPWLDLRAYRAVSRHIRSGRFTIVHTHTTKAGLLARQAAWTLGTPVILHTVHGWQWTHARSGLMNRMIITAERRAARYSDRLIVVSERDRDKGLEAGVGRPEQYVCIESAIDLDRFTPERADGAAVRRRLGIPDTATVAGTVGRFAYQKAPEIMLRAAGQMIESRPDLHFIYVGDGPLREEVLAGVGDLASHPRLHILGLSDDIPSLVAAMDLFVLSSRYEGLPRVAVEAMALGKPVVSTPADGIVDVVEEGVTGLLRPFEDWHGLAGAALELAARPELRRRLGEEGRRRVVRRFSLKDMVRRIEALYEDLLEEKQAGARA